jgi:hypothetical protein
VKDLKVIYIIEVPGIYIRQETSNMVTSYSGTNVMLVTTMMIVLMILSICGTFDNVAAVSLESFFQRKKASVNITNALGGTTQLHVHCKSGDDNLGPHDININASYIFTFRPDLGGSTEFTCNFSWDRLAYTFMIYDHSRDYKICRKCRWKIFTDQHCEYNYDTEDYDICDKWTG